GLYKGYRSALATIFLEPNPSGPSIGSILRSKSNSYWKVSTYANIQNILSLIKRESLTGGKFMGTVIREISKGLELHFFNNKKKLEKKILIFAQGIFLSYKVWVFDQVLKEVDLPFPVKAMKRTLDEISNLMQYVFSLKVCCGQSTV
ncbi:10264_t:CDS:1, partial [Rhizophagus irregularis]